MKKDTSLHTFSRSTRQLSRAALGLALLGSSVSPLALAETPATTTKTHTPPPLQAKPPVAQQSPYARLLLPLTQKLLAKSPAPGSSAAAASAGSAASGLTKPDITASPINFPGFPQTVAVPAVDPADSSFMQSAVSLDVNKDGLADLVDVQTDGTLNVLINPGTGNFADFHVTSTLPAPVAGYIGTNAPGPVIIGHTDVADLNKDGYPDVIVTDTDNTAVWVYINNRKGSFEAPVEYAFDFSTDASFYESGGGGIVIGDVNGDGIPDMVASGYYSTFNNQGQPVTTVSLLTLLGKGNGTFAAPLAEQTATISGLQSFATLGQMTLADMNNDGKVDLILPVGGYDAYFDAISFVPVLLGKGNGTFSAYPSTVPTTGFVLSATRDYSYGSVYAGDVNGDGKIDLLLNDGDGKTWLSLGNGDGTLGTPTAVISGDGNLNSGGAETSNFVDINGDGFIDMVSYHFGYVAVYLGEAGGAFNPNPVTQLTAGVSGDIAVGYVAMSEQPKPAEFTMGGKLDLVQLDEYTGSAGFYPQVNGQFTGVQALAIPGHAAINLETVALGDFTGDGVADVLAFNLGNEGLNNNYNVPDLVLGANNGKGQFAYSTIFSGTGVMATSHIDTVEPFTVDFNHDGLADILMSSYNYQTSSDGGLLLSLNTGKGTFAAPVSIPLGVTPSCPLNYADVGDINGDGYPDIVVAYPGDTSCYYYGTPGPTPSGFFTLINDGKGHFTPSFTPYGYEAYIAKLVDLNGDHKLDIVVSDLDASIDAYFLYAVPGNGDGTFNLANAQYVLESTMVASVIPGDYDGDGKQDLIVGVVSQIDGNGNPVYGTTGNYALKGNGDFTFQLPVQYTNGNYSTGGAYSDVNNDGRPDLVLSEAAFNYATFVPTGNLVTLINLGGAFIPGAPSFTAPLTSNGSLFVADVNNDGAPDAVESSAIYNGDGELSELFLNRGASNLALVASASKITDKASITLTSTLKTTITTPAPTGTVTFYNNRTPVGIAELSGGWASATFSDLPVGVDTLTAIYSGDSNYNAASATTLVTVTTPAPANPSFSPAGGTYAAAQTVTLTSTQGATIYYTTNGTTPSAGSKLYTKPLTVASTETIKAIAILNGVPSGVSTATFTINSNACQTIDYSKGFTTTGISLNGGAKVAKSLLQLTDGGLNEARSAFFTEAVPVTNFDTEFTFQLLDPSADGLTFTLQSNNPNEVGANGAGLGYAGIPNSVALKFDLYNNAGEGTDSTGIYLNGASPTTPAINLAPAHIDLHSGHVFDVHLAYANSKTTASITDLVTGASASTTLTGDLTKVLGDTAYVGFTAGTGGLSATQNILAWTYSGGETCSTK